MSLLRKSGLRNKVIAIVGIGQIGGSIALALKGKVKKVIGVSRHPRSCKTLVDYATNNLQILKEADVIILSRTVNEIIKLLSVMEKYAKKSALILDVGSTKTKIMNEAAKRRLNFIGGHPIAGTEKYGPTSASNNLLKGKYFILVGKKNIIIDALVKTIGSKPVWLKDPSFHDRSFAITSHIPHLIAYGLCLLFSQRKVSRFFIGSSFRSAIRVACSNPRMISEMLKTNRNNIKSVLSEFIQNLNGILNSDTSRRVKKASLIARKLYLSSS